MPTYVTLCPLQPPRKDLHHGKVQGYYIGYKEVEKEEAEFQYKNVEALDVTSGARLHQMSHLTNLKRKTSYVVKVQAYNSEGAGPMSDDVRATTLEADYVLHYQVKGGDWQQKALSTNSNKYTVEGLKCGSVYSLYMTATNSLGTAEPRDIIYARTKGADDPLSKCRGSVDNMGMAEFCAMKQRLQQQQLRHKEEEAYSKGTSFYASPARKPVPVSSDPRM
ncbi:hypothetical protein IscW_ISCW017418 [Ixodes scapularis]|uniref:Fibronectin type-III domain-containing protein n=1 Tax=Ixodes scapularis TaxID=6945 RepID=B7PCC6_IXOSC|nr:hypothetical protein IscW_ISCW017418 [Ixodes scapularis]|eukprot:XP_002409644.1 hypothetical protein IscW_ISCW017418 [Ixodes scapularis]